ncbi:P27 family phage terminase small subunit [Bacillus sp. 1P02SD]|uniref:P27 family phage terminase small subunit n=1 Tax=Bacillus sp. 1P02SD TaxID=3132264 RepID=UPI0039A1D079
MAVAINNLKKQLMAWIDTDDLLEVEKVERYIDLVKSFRKISKIINKEGESVTTINGSQEFTKAHPLISERNKINAQLIALGKDLDLVNKSKYVIGNSVESEYSSSDLI